MSDPYRNSLYNENRQESINYLVDKSIYETKTLLSTYKMPRSNKLIDCLNGYSKEQLYRLSEINGIYIKKSWNKTLLVDTIDREIAKTMTERVCSFTDEELELLNLFLSDTFQSNERSLEEFNFYTLVYPTAVKLGLLFIASLSNEVVTVHTDELRHTINQIQTIRKTQAVQRFKKIERLIECAVDLYGVVSFNMIIQLWRVLYPNEKVTIESYDLFHSCIHIILAQDSYFLLYNNHLASMEFSTKPEAEVFLKGVEHYFQGDYYIPSKNELEDYLEGPFRQNDLAYRRLRKFVEQSSDFPEDVMETIDYHLKFGSGFSSVVNELYESVTLRFKTQNNADQFAQLYVSVMNSSRSWQFRGYTRLELSDRFKGIVARYDNVDSSLLVNNTLEHRFSKPLFDVDLLQVPVHNPYKNVSRNDPCPCGSGKKFKKCCGR